ncbi:MAG: A/G-specific adenine glycosylase [Chloroflexi bacterium]|nr:A/G-specific adenine glycosylase [Chloroflexota bacterium]
MPSSRARRSPYLAPLDMRRISSRLLNWYRQNGRILPWRGHADPYAVWVSEIMLQQTRVETVLPYFEKWMRQFPTVQALANASEQEVLNAWEGLGYYSRARNFHKAAKIVAEKYNGALPRDLDELGKLPGIGRYTVGALASIVFGMDEPALDGNLKRVYARLFDVRETVDSSEGERILWRLARENLPKGEAADFNQALMDLGALICLPRNPRCLLCPVMEECKARKNGTQEIRPVKKAKSETPSYVHAAAVVMKRGRVLLARRPSKGLLAGMWEFPNVRVDGDPAGALTKAMKTAYNLRLRVKRETDPIGMFRHAYTHFKVTVHVFDCELISAVMGEDLTWIPLKDLDEYPMGRVDRQIAETIRQ